VEEVVAMWNFIWELLAEPYKPNSRIDPVGTEIKFLFS
jgi:hypothetical protein